MGSRDGAAQEADARPTTELRYSECLRAARDFPFFTERIFPLSFPMFTPAEHLAVWAEILQFNPNTALLAGRGSLKSTLFYDFCMWRLWRCGMRGYEWDTCYFSFNQRLAAYHTTNINKLIRRNPCFAEARNLSKAASILQYSWSDGLFECHPEGVLGFNRGFHRKEVLLDDILADPSSSLNITIIKKVGEIFRSDIMPIPVDNENIHLAGTAQHPQDIFFELKAEQTFNWSCWPAILNDATKTVLWPQKFPYEKLKEIERMQGIRTFRKEYLCSPVWTEDSYFPRDQLLKVMDALMQKVPRYKGKERVFAGWDVGKKQHPSHICAYKRDNKGNLTELNSIWFDVGTPYNQQVEDAKLWAKLLGIETMAFDNTRAELEGFWEKNTWDKGGLPQSVFIPVTMSAQMKASAAAQLEKYLYADVGMPTIRMLPDQRQLDLMLTVRNDLKAIETPDGHGESFMSHLLLMEAMAEKDENASGGFALSLD